MPSVLLFVSWVPKPGTKFRPLVLGYHLDYYTDIRDNLLDLDEEIITSHYAYSEEYGFDPKSDSLSGLSLNAMYDSRDSAINAYRGRYALASFRYNFSFLGSDQDASSLWLEYRDYFDLSQGKARDILAIWAFGNFTTSGDLPYLDLPATSYDQFAKSGRGYVQGRFRGKHMLYTEVEYRRHLFDAWKFPVGAVAFLNAQTASSEGNNIGLFEYIEPGGGGGLRVMLQKTTRTNLTLDYGVGAYGSSGMYIRLNETF